MGSIEMVEIGNINARWGVKAGDYNVTVDDATSMMDFQDLMVRFSKQRAVAVEGEVEPLSTRMQQRNDRIDELSEALAELTEVQAEFDSDAFCRQVDIHISVCRRKIWYILYQQA